MIIVANWKAYLEDFGKAKLLAATSKKIARTTDTTLILAPSAPFLSALASKNTSKVQFAAQDISATLGGAMTGESTAQMYSGAGATYAILGHSERRATGDTNTIVSLKITHALACNLTPILCVGEEERDRDGRYLSFIREEIVSAFAGLTAKERSRIIIAYEPLWAIGKHASAAITANDLAEMVLYIRKVLAEFLPGNKSTQALILYGGSVDPENIRELARTASVNGFLVGRASIDAVSLTKLVRQLS